MQHAFQNIPNVSSKPSDDPAQKDLGLNLSIRAFNAEDLNSHSGQTTHTVPYRGPLYNWVAESIHPVRLKGRGPDLG